jgi:hypothetical protein
MRWCEHISKRFQYQGWEFIITSTSTILAYDWLFCPKCGTPRPKEQTLAEKFHDYLGARLPSNPFYVSAVELSKIASKHFEEGGK